MPNLMKFERSLMKNPIDFQIDLKIEISINKIDSHIDTKISNRIHISTLFSSSKHWQTMLKHSHENEFRKVAQLEYEVFESYDTWEIMNTSSLSDHQKIFSFIWTFIYKNDSNDYLIKYKVRIMIKDDL
jgi:hypothetical protein